MGNARKKTLFLRCSLMNTDGSGNLDLDAFQRAVLSYRNTPSPDSGISPARCLFGRPIKDFIPIHKSQYEPHHTWSDTLDKREEALRNRHQRLQEVWSEHTKSLPPLEVGDLVRVQNQFGNAPRKWDKTGTVVEVRQHNQYVVKIDGSGRATLRNRRFLRKYEPMFPRKPRSTLSDRLQSRPALRFYSNAPTSPVRVPIPPRSIVEHYRDDDTSMRESNVPCSQPDRPAVLIQPPKAKLAVRRLNDFNKKGLKE